MTNDVQGQRDEGRGQNGVQFLPMEQCICLGCQNAIPRELVVAQIRTIGTGPTRQRVRAWCEHCKSMFELHRELRNGQWQIIGAVEIVADEKRREQFLHRIQAQRGILDAA